MPVEKCRSLLQDILCSIGQGAEADDALRRNSLELPTSSTVSPMPEPRRLLLVSVSEPSQDPEGYRQCMNLESQYVQTTRKEAGCHGWSRCIPHDSDSSAPQHRAFMHFATWTSKDEHDHHLTNDKLTIDIAPYVTWPTLFYYETVVSSDKTRDLVHQISSDFQSGGSSVIIASKFTYKPDVSVADLSAILDHLARRARKSDGCIGFDAGRTVDIGSNDIFVIQEWRDELAHQNFRRTSICQKFESTAVLMEGPSVVSRWKIHEDFED